MGAAGRRVTFRPAARIRTIAASLAAAAILLLPNAALAATLDIGSAQGTFVCVNAGDYVQASSRGPSYAVPSGGTSITSWHVLAGIDTGPVALEVWRPTAPPLYTLVGISPIVTLNPNTLNDFTLAAPISHVQPGDLIGLRLERQLECSQETLNFGDTIGSSFSAAPPAVSGTELLPAFGGFQLNVAATVDVTVTPPPPPPTPTSADQCKDAGWQNLTDSQGMPFKNQGDCLSFVAMNGTNLAG